jgi:thymidylate synthase
LERCERTEHRCQTRNLDYEIEKIRVIHPDQFGQICRLELPNPATITVNQLELPVSTWETQYRELIDRIWDEGHLVASRSGDTRSLFGAHLRCDLSKEYPVVSCKKGYPKTIFEELMWMIRGDTDVRNLRKAGVAIWNGHSSEEFLRDRGLPWREGDIGPGYGFQMRHAGAPYSGCDTDYHGQGVDQLAEIVRLLREDPTSRRIILNLWHVNQISEMSLPPCHMLYQWGVELYPEPTPSGKLGKLNCHLFQRSWDIMLGWNPATAALLTHLLAATCHYDLGELVHSISDVHVYQDHRVGVEELRQRPLCNSPRLQITKRHDDLRDYQFSDTMLDQYYPMPPIRMKMAI